MHLLHERGLEVGGVKYEPKTKARLIDELTLVVD